MSEPSAVPTTEDEAGLRFLTQLEKFTAKYGGSLFAWRNSARRMAPRKMKEKFAQLANGEKIYRYRACCGAYNGDPQ